MTPRLGDDLREVLGVEGLSYNIQNASTDEQLPADDVASAGTVTLKAASGNNGVINIGGDTYREFPLAAGESVGNINVDNTQQIHVEAPNVGDTIYIFYEVDD